MNRIATELQRQIVVLRKQGFSIPEISSKLSVAKTTAQRYVQNVQVPAEHLKRLKEKQGGAKERAAGLRANVSSEAGQLLGTLSSRDYMMLLIGLYWGEGTKKDFGIINSDPFLIQAFIKCLEQLGIRKERLAFSLRVHSDISIPAAIEFWARTTGLPAEAVGSVEIIEGKKKGKLVYGMCRVRVKSGIRERLLLQSAIDLIGKDCENRLVSPQALVV